MPRALLKRMPVMMMAAMMVRRASMGKWGSAQCSVEALGFTAFFCVLGFGT